MIPKIIHYCWLSGDPIPVKFQLYMNGWKEKLPDYEFILWDAKRFDLTQSLWVRQAFSVKKYAFAADYIRLYAIYTYGGIYMDMDVEVLRSFNPLLGQQYILGYESNGRIEAGIFGGERGAEWIKKCLDYYIDRPFIQQDGTYDLKPLPEIMSDILCEEMNSFYIYSCDFFTAKSFLTGKIQRTSNTYTIHHFAGSWTTPKQKLYHFVQKQFGQSFAKTCSHVYKFMCKLFFCK